MTNLTEAFQELVAVVAKLRDPNGGCPWDLEQTHQSLKPYVIEEAHEVVEAIDAGPGELKKELGDLLLQVVLHAQVGKDQGTFTLHEVIDGITKKLIERHPHVFGDKQVQGSKQVLQNWEQAKKAKLQAGQSILDGVPRSMPALLRAQRIGEKAARVGFEWRNVREVQAKVIEEIRELVAELDCEKPERVADEFGDILFALTQLARRLGVNSEDLLNQATNKFVRRFKEMERRAGPAMAEMGVEKLDRIWEEVKAEEKNRAGR